MSLFEYLKWPKSPIESEAKFSQVPILALLVKAMERALHNDLGFLR